MENKNRLSLLEKLLIGTIALSSVGMMYVANHKTDSKYSLIPMGAGLVASFPLQLIQLKKLYK